MTPTWKWYSTWEIERLAKKEEKKGPFSSLLLPELQKRANRANFSRPVLFFGQSTQKNVSSTGASMNVALVLQAWVLVAPVLEAQVLVAPVQPANNTSATSN